jgi:hypothetical protein
MDHGTKVMNQLAQTMDDLRADMTSSLVGREVLNRPTTIGLLSELILAIEVVRSRLRDEEIRRTN